MNRREQRVKAARYLARNFPDKYYLSYSSFNELYVWERTGALMDWLVDVIV